MRFEVIVSQTIFSEPTRRRGIVERAAEQSLAAVLIHLKKFRVLRCNLAETSFWMSETVATVDGRKRYEVNVFIDGHRLSREQIEMINGMLRSIDAVKYFA